MKRIFSYAAIVAAIFAMSACSGTQKSTDSATEVAEVTDFTPVQETYAGVLPAADADGIQYTVVLDYNSDGSGEYDMTQVYMMADSTASFKTSGNFTAARDENTGKKYIKLAGDTPIDDVYFVVATDSTIVMADATLATPDTPGMNYTLTAVE